MEPRNFAPEILDNNDERKKQMKTMTKRIHTAFAAVTLAIGALAPNAFGVSPPPDGGYAGGNTAEGQNALLSLSTGGYNTAVGFLSLLSNTTSSFNTALGAGTLLANTAENNTATGAGALLSNSTGELNTANGAFALLNNTTGQSNTAIGASALGVNTIGNWNTATGTYALSINQTGTENTAYGQVALSNVTGSKNIGIGAGAGCKLTTGNNNIAIENPGVAGESNTIRIGDVGTETNCAGFPLPAHTVTYIAGISGTAVVGDPVVVDANGQLGTASSSARFKKEIRPMDKTSEAILALKPVTFRYKSDSKDTPQFGLIAEEVAKIDPDLVVRDRNGEIYSVRYEAVNAMLLNEFLKEHRIVQTQQKEIATLKAELKEQRTLIQRVNDKVEFNRRAPQTVTNDR
jgi:hypothetical protein